jgi:hypothetical protein
MTLIVGLVEKTEEKSIIHMGADSLGSNGFTKMVCDTPKMFRVKDFLIGCTGTYRMCQLLRHTLRPPHHEDGVKPIDYLVKELIPAIQSLFENAKYSEVEKSVQSGGNFLIGYRGQLYEVQSDFSVLEVACGYNAVGSGEYLAMGSFASTDGESVKTRMQKALAAGEKHCCTVAGPFHFDSMEWSNA